VVSFFNILQATHVSSKMAFVEVHNFGLVGLY